ncbi:CoA transferase [Sphingobium sp.]|uniref:CoA transferase n=1 Tax=Sphingobium sp. TaxID=1912891 RepID=UPI002CCCD73D|nr:CoA transferase [Sphingobium sp.]HUD92691.1 CoA transferase [Sphingobium sp.]
MRRFSQSVPDWSTPQSPGDWNRLTALLKESLSLASDPRFAKPDDRAAHDAALAGMVSTLSATRPAADWESALLPQGVACVVVWDGPVETNFIDEDGFARISGFTTNGVYPFLEEMPRLRAAGQLLALRNRGGQCRAAGPGYRQGVERLRL